MIDNVEFVFVMLFGFVGYEGLWMCNYSMLFEVVYELLIVWIECDFDFYLSNVLLELEDNIRESVGVIFVVIGCEDFEFEDVEIFFGW